MTLHCSWFRVARLTLGFLTALLLSSCGYSPGSWLSFLPVNVAACDKPLAAEIRMVAPHWGPPRADMDVVWEVIATGCTGRYRLVEYPQAQPFRAFSHYSKVYGSVRRVEERVTVQSIDWRGNVLDQAVAVADPFTTSPEAGRFLSPPAEARAESIRPREDRLGCRIEKQGALSPNGNEVQFQLIADGDIVGANVNGYTVVPGANFTVPANEYKVFRAIGSVYGKNGHAVCQSYFVAPRCTISLVENSFDLVRKKLTALGRIEKLVWDGTQHSLPAGIDSITIDEIPTRVGNIETQATVYGPEGDEGSCKMEFAIPDPEQKIQPLRAIASSTWNDALPKKAIDGTTQQGWIAETKGKGWIRVDLGRPFKLSRLRLCIDQSKAGLTKHEVFVGQKENELHKIANFSDITNAGQWLEKLVDEKDVRFVEVRTLETNSQVSWREIELYQCTTFRRCNPPVARNMH
jgi:hypothetical protein